MFYSTAFPNIFDNWFFSLQLIKSFHPFFYYMFKNFTRFMVAASLLTATGCAGSYHAINPDRINTYQAATAAAAPVGFSYHYSALLSTGPNKKYVKKERQKGYQVVAVQLKNNTNADLNFARDMELTFGDRVITPVPNVQAANDLKQGVAIYLLYLLLNFNVGSVMTVNGQIVEDNRTFIPTGPFIAGGNMLGASGANKNLRREFIKYDLTNKVIHPGETAYGIIALRETGVAPLRVTLRNQAALTTPTTAPTLVPQAAPATPVAPPAASPAPTGSGK